jgi:hypothetical protein
MDHHALLTVRYAIGGDPARLRAGMEKAAGAIATTPGLVFKLWGFDAENRLGVSAYLFDSEQAARAFADGPMIAGLRANPEVADVTVAIAPVDRTLSAITGAEAVLATPALAVAA